MAYDSIDNPPRIVTTLGITGSPPAGSAGSQPGAYASSLWLYETAVDTHIQCEAAGYFTNGGSLGMKVGDIVLVSSTAPGGAGVTAHLVTNVAAPTSPVNLNSPGAATIGSASGGQNSVATGLVSTGAGSATQASALPLEADINMFATTSANTGTILPALNPGDCVVVFNGGAANLPLFPPVGAQINALGVNAYYMIATATPLCEVKCVSATQYLASQAA